MIVVPNNPVAGDSVNLSKCVSISRAQADSNYANSAYEIVFTLDHAVMFWRYDTVQERDSSWSDITTSLYCRMCGPVSNT